MSERWPDLTFPPINLLSLGKENSPCKKICELDINNKCVGCLRTIEEIQCWTIYDPHEKLKIISRIYAEDPTVFE
jgi:predicted Fe-S protein YdhL (DUF1289 family)